MNYDAVFTNKYFILNKHILRSISLWPYQKSLEKLLLRSVMVLCLVSLWAPLLIRGIEECYKDVIDIDLVVENIGESMSFTGICIKFFACMWSEKKFANLYEEISQDWEDITDYEEKKVLTRYVSVGRRLTIYYGAFMYANIVPYTSLPAVVPMLLNRFFPANETREKELLYHGEYFVDQQKYFIYLYLHSIVTGIVICTISVGIDCTYVNCVQHALGLFHLVDYKLKKIPEMVADQPKRSPRNIDKDVHRQVIDSIKIHQRSIEIANRIQDAYNYCFFFVSICLVLFFSLLTVNLQRNLHNFVRLHRIFTLWFGTIVYMFYINWPGQKLIDTSNEICSSIYGSSSWFHFPPKTKTLIKLMLLQSSKSSTLTAGPLLVMKFECCSSLLQMAFSYFAVVAALSE